MNITLHCHECHKPLGLDRYITNPVTGGVCQNKAWCPTCYELLRARTTTDNSRFWAEVNQRRQEDKLYP